MSQQRSVECCSFLTALPVDPQMGSPANRHVQGHGHVKYIFIAKSNAIQYPQMQIQKAASKTNKMQNPPIREDGSRCLAQ